MHYLTITPCRSNDARQGKITKLLRPPNGTPRRVGDAVELQIRTQWGKRRTMKIGTLTKVTFALVFPLTQTVELDGLPMERADVELLAHNDGFRSVGEFFEFHLDEQGAEGPRRVEVLEWE